MITEVDPNLIAMLDEAVKYVNEYGVNVPDQPSGGYSGGSGSDAVSVNSSSTATHIDTGKFEAVVLDHRYQNSSGTHSVSWTDRRSRTLELKLNGELKINATRILGGETGHSGVISGSSKTEIKPTEWEVQEASSVDAVAEQLSAVPEFYE